MSDVTPAATPPKKQRTPNGQRAAMVLEVIRRWNAEQRSYTYADLGREVGVAGFVAYSAVLQLCAAGKLKKAQRLAFVDGWVEPEASTETKAA